MATDILDLSRDALVQVLLIIAGAWLSLAILQRLIPALAERFSGRHRLYILAILPTLRLVILVGAIGFGLTRVVEPTFENMITLLGAVGLALAFALKDWVSGIIAGIVTLYELPYRIGDWITIDGVYGEVKSIGMRAVKLVTPDNTAVFIPHLRLWDTPIFNANDGTSHMQCSIHFYLDPQHESLQVRETLKDVVLTSPMVQLQKPILVIAEDKTWGTHYLVRAYPVAPRDQFRFITDVTLRGKVALQELGVTLAPLSRLIRS